MKQLSFPRISGIIFAFLWLVGMVLGVSLSFLSSLPALAQTQTQTRSLVPIAARVPRAVSAGHVTIMILDMSGSMAQNDPLGLRCSAADAYIDLSGIGDFIGVVGLDNNNGVSGGTYNFLNAQQWTPQPVDMSAKRQRDALKQLIAQSSNNCRPDGTTPTYNSLELAFQMLTSATNNGQYSGSVILLTDGVPYPNSDTQVAKIQSDLVPKFQKNNWPIDTIALGSDTSFHSFLSGISDATSGKFYDDEKGPVQGVSPLNIGPFFADIFARRNSLKLTPQVPVTNLGGATVARNFDVTDFTQRLAVLVVKDQAGTDGFLRTPDGQQITQTGAGVSVYTDKYYKIFDILTPRAGVWEIDINGSGSFLMDSLTNSKIGVSITSPSNKSHIFALNQPVPIAATISSNGQPVTDNSFTLTGTIKYGGANGAYSHQFQLHYNPSTGQFEQSVVLPFTAPAGSYDVEVDVSGASQTDVIASALQSVRVELFPEPLFFDKGTPTTDSVKARVIRWDPLLQLLYRWPFIMTGLSQWPLDHNPALPDASVKGGIYVGQNLYSNATVDGTATLTGSTGPTASTPVQIVNDGSGYFHVVIPASASGRYLVNFTTTGSFADSHGDLTSVVRNVDVTVVDPTLLQEGAAWGKTILYIIIAWFLVRLVLFRIYKRPFGEWQRQGAGEDEYGAFKQARRNPVQAFLHRNIVNSEDTGMPGGLQFRFRYGRVIEARASGPESLDWRRADDKEVQPDFQPVSQLRYKPREEDYAAAESIYTINANPDAPDDYNQREPETWEQEREREPRSRSQRGLFSRRRESDEPNQNSSFGAGSYDDPW